jgi:predicted nucleotidyltransferase
LSDMKFESFEKKLYLARDLEGAPNHEQIEVIRALEKRLEENETFVGLAPFGSVVSGYSTKESDLDVYALYDWPLGISSETWNAQKIDEIKQEIEKEYGIKINFIPQNINPEHIVHDIGLGVQKDDPGEYVATAMAEMTRIVTGKKIDEYRKTIIEYLHGLSSKQKNQLTDSIVESLARRDGYSLFKRVNRMNEFSAEEHQRILEERRRMWNQRVLKIWDLETGEIHDQAA